MLPPSPWQFCNSNFPSAVGMVNIWRILDTTGSLGWMIRNTGDAVGMPWDSLSQLLWKDNTFLRLQLQGTQNRKWATALHAAITHLESTLPFPGANATEKLFHPSFGLVYCNALFYFDQVYCHRGKLLSELFHMPSLYSTCWTMSLLVLQHVVA